MKKIALHWKILIGLILGIIWAIISSFLKWSSFTNDWITPFGSMFINLLKLIAVPLVLFSIIKGIAELKDISKLRRIGLKTLGLYLITTVLAITVGLVLANIIRPGERVPEEQRLKNHASYEAFLNAGNDASQTIEATPDPLNDKIQTAKKIKDASPLQFLVDIVPSNIFSSLMDITKMLQVIFFAILFGAVLMMLPEEKSAPMAAFIDSGNEVFLKMVDVIMQSAPFFVFCLMAGNMAALAGDDPANMMNYFQGLGIYSLTVILGLAVSLFITYPLILRLFTKQIPYKDLYRAIGPAQILAFSSSSSAATLPVTMDCVTENLGVSKRIASFTLPIGATVNMDGTSLYQAVAVIFLAQFHMVDLTLGNQLTIVLMATLMSIGTAPVPGVGIIMLIIVLESVGLDPGWIAIILPIDRILDMCRTVVNVTGDAAVTAAIASTENELNYVSKKPFENFDL
ncbi:MAG: dicarboxylate/amino acid:cation symporter [Bacteroidetes bacterium]|nr:dicarboxylate/amino acid:cation symporter [Bacteroidota bacterium]MBP7399353.1 dicarboxylate/amino acid:cation symporter [Chitinophagales bacterium]MBK7109660.1 dicarboxylate/amino acid:cation symporter [Bacteroidota bacterium]MBP8755086.1 dicarboxylate/amino acid:cation symporter [Chitinophagales bacterium]MBP9190304.1 dicarboxylate/amino acid:cation symporter [Chitinophagales bacterium]